MDITIYIGIAIAIILIAGLSIFNGIRQTKQNKPAGNNNYGIVAGIIMGTLVGGSSTVGTAQLAYNYGMSAWWFTLGGGIACVFLALVLSGTLRHQNKKALPEIIEAEYGKVAGLAASIFTSVGTFINILSQMIAASAVVLVAIPTMGTTVAIIIATIFMIMLAHSGGSKGSGIVGILKMILLYVSMLVCGIMVLIKMGGVNNFIDMVSEMKASTGVDYFSLFCRGIGTDIGAGFSLLLGIATTQTYAMAVISAKSDATARKGALISAVLIPPIGICGILVGLYMRSVTDPSVFVAKTALTEYILNYSGIPKIIAGFILGTLFIASVGTGAGLSFGIADIIDRTIIKPFVLKSRELKNKTIIRDILIVVLLALGCYLSCGSLGDTILHFAFMSMGLRGAAIFAPLIMSGVFHKKIEGKFATYAIIAGPVIVFLFSTVPALKELLHGWDALFPAVFVAFAIMIVGYLISKKDNKLNQD